MTENILLILLGLIAYNERATHDIAPAMCEMKLVVSPGFLFVVTESYIKNKKTVVAVPPSEATDEHQENNKLVNKLRLAGDV